MNYKVNQVSSIKCALGEGLIWDDRSSRLLMTDISNGKLIELDVISWITNVFVIESGNLSEYTLEYGLAFLMNLSLRCTGRDKCEKVSVKIILIFIE
jgi:sugar lactone lactonase YvrE